MKKTLSIILMLAIFIMTLSFVSFAEENTRVSIFIIDEKKVKMPLANVTFDGEALESDVSPFIMDDRTLVPVGVISKKIGAEVGWSAKQRQVTIRKDAKVIVLTIDSPVVSVNGVRKNLPDNVPPKIANDRTVIPVRFLSEELGVDVGWDNNTKTVVLTSENAVSKPDSKPASQLKLSSFKYENKKLVLNLDGANVYYSSVSLVNPDRLVLDIKGAMLNLNSNEYNIGKDYIQKIRFSQFQQEPPVVRVVVDMESSIKTNIKTSGNSIVVDFENELVDSSGSDVFDGNDAGLNPDEETQVSETENKQDQTNNESSDAENSLFQESDEERYVEVKLDQSKSIMGSMGDQLPTDTLGFMFLEESDPPGFLIRNGMNASKFKSFYLANPQRLVFDFYDMKLDGDGYIEEKLDRDFIDSYRAYYYIDENRTRLVLTLKDHVFKERLKIQEGEGNIIVYQKDSEIENDNMQYKYYGGYSTLEIIQDEYEAYAEKEYSGYENFLKLKVRSENIDMVSETLEFDDKFTDKVEIDVASKYTYIYVYLKDEIKYNIIEDGSKGNIMIEFGEKKVESGKKLIVIDPGHGGIKPGAISPIDKTKEKDIALSTAKELQSVLLSRGYDVYMIRSGDDHVDNYERTAIANEKNAALYISIHYNSINNSNTSGIETLYYPSENMASLEERFRVGSPDRDNKTLAKMVNTAIIKQTGAKNRGIVPRPKLIVTRETIMPAVLVEGGFMTNTSELSKIKSSSYQKKIATGIADGIDEYLKSKN